MKIASSQESSAKPAGPWDNAFNRALNKVKKVDDVTAKPSSAGRVVGFGPKLVQILWKIGGAVRFEGAQGEKDRRRYRLCSWTGGEGEHAFAACPGRSGEDDERSPSRYDAVARELANAWG